MVTIFTLLLTFLNFILIIGIIVYYFLTHFIIVERSLWDSICENLENSKEVLESIEEPQELTGGSGFFKEYIEEDEEYEDE